MTSYSDNSLQSVFSESAAAKEKEEAEHGNQSDRLKRRDHTPNDIVHDGEAEATQTGPVEEPQSRHEDRGRNKVWPS
ncbi:hypothetical protein CRYUN_Cryun09bG0172300 [Craigia yunnanensis]